MKVALYARISDGDQHGLPMQIDAMKAYAAARDWQVIEVVEEIASGAKDQRPKRALVLKRAARREIDGVIVWRLDRWGRNTVDLLRTLQELQELGVTFVSLTEALDFSTSTGRLMAGIFAVFAQFEREVIQERVRAGVRRYRKENPQWGRPATAKAKADEVLKLAAEGKNKTQIAKLTGISRASVIRIIKS